MRRYKRMLILGCLVLLAGSLLFSGRLLPKGRLPRPEAFAQINKGMTQAEVEALVGGPPGYYGRYPIGSCKRGDFLPSAGPGTVEKPWHDDQHFFRIFFDSAGRVVWVFEEAGYERNTPQSVREWYQDIRSQLGWP